MHLDRRELAAIFAGGAIGAVARVWLANHFTQTGEHRRRRPRWLGRDQGRSPRPDRMSTGLWLLVLAVGGADAITRFLVDGLLSGRGGTSVVSYMNPC